MNLVKLHQTIHGYAGGHRLLASSVPSLNAKDTRTLLLLSDMSGAGTEISPSGYLTGYPLPDAGMYALATTWAASEMPRPGCVWTHTFLITFADLAVLKSAGALRRHFRRPSIGKFEKYQEPISVMLEDERETDADVPESWTSDILRGIYGTPAHRIIYGRDFSQNFEQAVLEVWSQQWPRLKRSFRFCTLATSDRSFDGNTFDLQLFSSDDRGLRSRFRGATEPPPASSEPNSWIEYALEDLKRPEISGLREFFRLYGPDFSNGRAAFSVLCDIQRLLTRPTLDAEACDEILGLLERFSSQEGERLAEHIASEFLTRASGFSELTLRFLLNRLDAGTLEPSAFQLPKIIDAVVSIAPGRIPFILSILGADAGRTFIRDLPEVQLRALVAAEPELIETLVGSRSELLEFPDFWKDRAHDKAGLDALGRIEERDVRARIVAVIRGAERTDLASQVVERVGASNFLQVVAEAFFDSPDAVYTWDWIWPALRDPNQVAAFLANGARKPFPLLLLLARHFKPDQVPNEIGDDPWYLAVKDCEMGAQEKYSAQFFHAYLLTRAFGFVSRSVGQLFEICFEPIYCASAIDDLALEAWVTVEYRLPWKMYWIPWDRCKRLRAGLVTSFHSLDLSYSNYLNLARDDKVFAEVTEEFGDSVRGRRFLRGVLEEVDAHRLSVSEARRRIIKLQS